MCDENDKEIIQSDNIVGSYEMLEEIMDKISSIDVHTHLFPPEFHDMFSETAEVDIDYFPEYLRLSTISFSLSLVENLLGSLSEEIAKDLGISITLDERPLPYINKYILWLTRGCGLEIAIDKSMWKSLDAIRELRNRFIHRINGDIPDQVKKVISEMISSTLNSAESITDEFVDTSFKKLSELVKTIELSYMKFYDKINR